MESTEFKDYYEVLEISPNANADTIDRVFRYLAQRYHPDVNSTGDHIRFSNLVKAHETLRDPAKRAQYDIAYKHHINQAFSYSETASSLQEFNDDNKIQDFLLNLLYVKRRRSMNNPGMGNLELERLSGCPRERLEFHLWYLKEKGWISRLENGLLSITVSGVDHSTGIAQKIDPRRLLDAPTRILE